MRGHDHDVETSFRPKGDRIARDDGDLMYRAAAAGRTDVLGPAGMLGLQRAVGNAGVGTLVEEDRSPVHDVVNSGGQPLDRDTRTDMEARLGHDFGDVRVHTDGAAHESAKSVNAHAYTVGTNVVFQRDRYDPSSSEDTSAQGSARDCGDFADACQSGYTFFRRSTTTRSTADQFDTTHEWIYIVYDASKGPALDTGTTYGTLEVGKATQTAAYFVRYNGATGQLDMGPKLLDNQSLGHQTFPDISADGGTLHGLWWDSRNDSCYSPIRPIGNCADKTTVASLDVYATKSTDNGAHWTTPVKLTDAMSNGNYEQFDNRAVPFGGDYLTITSFGDNSFGTWTDWRNTVQGTDPREAPEDADAGSADVHQCRVVLTSPPDKKGNTTKSWSGDRCPHAGGIDQDIYGDKTP